MTTPVLLDSYDNVLVSPSYLITWGPQNGFDILGFAAYLWGSGVALCGTGDPPTVTSAAHQWLEQLTGAGMGMFGNLEIGANDPSNLGGPGGVMRATTAVQCYRALGVSPGIPLCLSNDNEVTNMANVVAFFTEASKIIRGAGYAPTMYGQSSVFQSLRNELDYLWHAPDGTVGPPWPKGTIIAQRPNYFVNPQGYTCDVDDVIDVTGCLWNLNGPLSPAPPSPMPSQEERMLIQATGTAAGQITPGSWWEYNIDRTGRFLVHVANPGAQENALKALYGTFKTLTCAQVAAFNAKLVF